MKTMLFVLACLTSFAWCAFSQVPVTGWVDFDSAKSVSRQFPGASLKEESTRGVLINFNIPGVLIREAVQNGRTFHRLSIPGRGHVTELGRPELPMIGQIVEIPLGVNVTAEIVKEKHTLLKGYDIYPAQKPRFNSTAPPGEFELDTARYKSDSLFPRQICRIEAGDLAVMRGHRFVYLRIVPVQYNPVTKELLGYSNVEVRIKYARPAQIDYIDRRKYSPAFERLFKSLAVNYRDPGRRIDRFGRKLLESSPSVFADSGGQIQVSGASYLMITDAGLYNSADPNNPVVKLEKWKKSKGYITKVVTTSSIPNGTTADGITAYLQNAYDTWDVPPVFVLLVGDADLIPTHYKTIHPDPAYNNARIGTDLYYSTLEGDDYIPDILVGRLSVDNTSQADAFISKIIDYEMNPPSNTGFYKNILLPALFEDVYPRTTDPHGNVTIHSEGREDGGRAWIECMEEVNTYFSTNYTPQRIYAYEGNYANGPQKYENGDPVPTNLLMSSGFSWNGSHTDISNALNSSDGVSFILFRDHGSRDGWHMPDFRQGNIPGLLNGNRTPVVFSIACETGWFDNETDDDAALAPSGLATGSTDESFCEAFTRRAGGGTQAIIGATRISFSGYNDFLAFGLVKAIWPDFNPQPNLSSTFPPLPSLSVTALNRMGQVLNYGKCFMEQSYRDLNNTKVEFELFHLFGDPEMVIYSKPPGILAVEYPSKIGSLGHQDFMVKVRDPNLNVPLPGAEVVLLQNNQILRSASTNAAGCVEFVFNAVDVKDIDIVVTSDDHRPFTGTIGVTPNGGRITRLDPDNAPVNAPFNIGGRDFSKNETVEIWLSGSLVATATTDANGTFGQVGSGNISITPPSTLDLGMYTITVHGTSSDRYAVDVMTIRSPHPIDLLMYSQYDNTTWYLVGGENPVWDNPDIQLYADNGDPVSSGDLHLGSVYTIRASIRNNTIYDAQNAAVTFSWAAIGAGVPFSPIQPGPVSVDVPAHSIAVAETKWAPGLTGHVCVQVAIYHPEDIYTNNNLGQENCHIGKAASPYVADIDLRNPTTGPSYVTLEVRQRPPAGEISVGKFWDAHVLWPEDQLFKPGENKNVRLFFDPDVSFIEPGDRAWFNLTAYVNRKMIGGVDFTLEKTMRRSISLHGGIGLPLHSYAENHKPGYFLKLDYTNPLTGKFYVHVIGGVNYFPGKTPNGSDDHIVSLNAYVKRNIYVWKYWHVTVEAGPGYYNVGNRGSAGGASIGVGLAVPVSEETEIGLGSYYHNVLPFKTDFLDLGLFVNYLL